MEYPKFYTREMINISRRNNKKTRKLLNVPKGYFMHHVDKTMRLNDPWRYIQWLPEDLEVLSHSEHSKEHGAEVGARAKIYRTGAHWPTEIKTRISNKLKGHVNTPEARAKQSLAIKGGNNPRARKVRCIETGEIFDCIKDANDKYGPGHIWQVCNGDRKTACGYHWEFV